MNLIFFFKYTGEKNPIAYLANVSDTDYNLLLFHIYIDVIWYTFTYAESDLKDIWSIHLQLRIGQTCETYVSFGFT